MLRQRRFTSYDPSGDPITSFSTIVTPNRRRGRLERQRLRRQRWRHLGARRHHRDLQLRRQRPRAARRQPLLRRSRSIPPTTTSTSTKATRWSSSTPPANRSAPRSGRGCSRTRSASPPTPARSAISNPGQTQRRLFGPPVIPPDPSTDNPLVVDSVSSPGARNTADFQVTPRATTPSSPRPCR